MTFSSACEARRARVLVGIDAQCVAKNASDEEKATQEKMLAPFRCESVTPRLTCGQLNYATQVCGELIERTDQLLSCLGRIKVKIVPESKLVNRSRNLDEFPDAAVQVDGRSRELGANERARRLRAKREWVESVLVSHARALEKKLSANRAAVDEVVKVAGSADEVDLKQLEKIRDATGCLAQRLVAIRGGVQLQPSDALFVDHRNYEAWTSRFSLGGEYLSVSNIGSDQVFPLASLAVYRSYATWERWRRPEVIAEFRLASSGEEVSLTSLTKEGSVGGASSLDARAALFWPLVRFGDSIGEEAKIREFIGPIADFGLRKSDEEGKVGQRYYGGVRIAANPEWYTDLLFGKTEGIGERRLEVRTQMPVANIASGQRIYLGAIYNFSAGGQAKSIKTKEDAPDVVRVFLTWNVEFKRLFGIK